MYHCLIFTQKEWYYLIIISDKSLQSDLLFASLKGYNDHKLCIHLNVSHWILQPWCLCCKRSRIYVISFDGILQMSSNVWEKCEPQINDRGDTQSLSRSLMEGQKWWITFVRQQFVCLSCCLFGWWFAETTSHQGMTQQENCTTSDNKRVPMLYHKMMLSGNGAKSQILNCNRKCFVSHIWRQH